MVADRLALSLGSRFQLAELFRLMEPEKVATHVSAVVISRLDEHVDDIMAERHAVLWANLPQLLRQRIYSRVARQLPSIMDNLIEDMAENVDELVDMRQLLASLVKDRRGLLPSLLEEVLVEERRFLVRVGGWVGGALGILQAFIHIYMPHASLLIAGAIGLAVAALLLPRMLLLRQGCSVYESSLDARMRLAKLWAHKLSRELFNLQHLMSQILSGPRGVRARSLIRRHARPLLEAGMTRTAMQMSFGIEGYAYFKQSVVERVTELTADALSDKHFKEQRCGRIEGICTRYLMDMQPAELKGMVQPILSEGFWGQVLAAAAVGLLMGLVQAALLHVMGG